MDIVYLLYHTTRDASFANLHTQYQKPILMLKRLSFLICLLLPFALISQKNIEADLQRFNNLIESADNLIAEKKYDRAFRKVNSAEKILDQFEFQPDSLKGDLLRTKGSIYFEKKDYDSAQEYLEKALTSFEKTGRNPKKLKDCFMKVGLLNIRS